VPQLREQLERRLVVIGIPAPRARGEERLRRERIGGKLPGKAEARRLGRVTLAELTLRLCAHPEGPASNLGRRLTRQRLGGRRSCAGRISLAEAHLRLIDVIPGDQLGMDRGDPFHQAAGAPGEKPTRHPPTNVAGEIERRGVIVQLVIDLGERERRMSVVDTPLGEGDPGGLEPSTGGGEITLPAHEAARQQPRSPGPYALGLSI